MVPGGELLAGDCEAEDLPPIAAAMPPAAAPPISARIKNFFPLPPLVAPAGSALICEITALAVSPWKEAVTRICSLPPV